MRNPNAAVARPKQVCYDWNTETRMHKGTRPSCPERSADECILRIGTDRYLHRCPDRNVYNWLSYEVVGNSVCRTWESCTFLFHVL